MMFKAGVGYDQHIFEAGKKLILGGIEIPFDKGLLGHSDGDALLHSLCNALLGALGRGDIGDWFPDTDPQFKDIDSSLLVRQVMNMVKRDGYNISNVDAMVIADEPMMTPHKEPMKTRIAELLDIKTDQVNIKATRTEGMGILSGGKGIAAYVIVLIYKADRQMSE